jgi:hypothetical protein
MMLLMMQRFNNKKNENVIGEVGVASGADGWRELSSSTSNNCE